MAKKKPPKDDKKHSAFAERFMSMTAQFDFSQLGSWKAASVVVAIAKGMRTQFGDMKNQLERAALSITMNLAEASGRFPRGGSNVSTLFSSSRGSDMETSNAAFQSALIHAGSLKDQDKEMILFALRLCSKASQEVERLINNNSLIATPGLIGVFANEEVAVLDHVLKEMFSGKNIYEIIGCVMQNGTRPETPQKNIVSCVCAQCGLERPKDACQSRVVRMSIDRISYHLPADFCNSCLAAAGEPEAIVGGKVIWKQKQEQPGAVAAD